MFLHSDTFYLILSQPVFTFFLTAANTNVIVFGLNPLGLKPTVYHTKGEHVNNNTTDAVDLGSENKSFEREIVSCFLQVIQLCKFSFSFL